VTFDELKRVLFARGNFGMKLGLERMREAMELLGNPHLAVPVLHVAGTNGKGSTCAFAEASLRAAGLRTGLYTSPHLVHFCERIRISGEPIAEQYAADLLEEIVRRVPWALRDDGLTFFELATAMAFLAFAREAVQIAVVEVGLGGRLDATNVVEPLACAVASIGLDHVQWLGPTLSHVAAEKAGIFKRGAPAVSAGQPRAAADALAARAAELGIPLWRPGRDYVFESRDVGPFCYAGPRGFRVSLGEREEVVGESGEDITRRRADEAAALRASGGLALLGHHQRGNAALACALLQVAADRGVPVRPEHLRSGLRTARWPGRLEVLAEAPLVVVDGAHNVHAARALARAAAGMFGGRAVQLVFAAMNDKDHAGMLRALLPLAAGVHLCAIESPRAAPPEQLAALVRELAPQICARGLQTSSAMAHPAARGPQICADPAASPRREAQTCAVHGNVAEAVQAARVAARRGGAVLCCGSLYLVAEVEAALRGGPVARMPSERL
jgi:dihydrofolate synthase/folylpolyglutamate synthase